MADLSVSASRERQLNQQQLEELKQEHERKLQQIRSDQQVREENTRASGEASVNHIRKTTNERIDNARNEADLKIRREEDAITQNYTSLKKRTNQATETLRRDLTSIEASTKESIDAARDRESRLIQTSQEKLRSFVEDQAKVRSRIQAQSTKEVDEIAKRASEQIVKTKASASNEILKTETEGKATVEGLKDRNRELYEETRSQAQIRLEQLRRDHDTKAGREINQSSESMNDVRKKTREATNFEQRNGERRLAEIEAKNTDQLERARARALSTNEKTQKEYSRETQRIETEGERQIRERQEKFTHLQKEQEASQNSALTERSTQFAAREASLRKESEARVQHQVKEFDDLLHQQRMDFKERFDKNDKTFKQSFGAQKENYLKELYKQKQKIDLRAGLETARSEDPFYRMRSFNASISESPGHYELTAQIAPHDKDTVEVRVKNDKITLSARRSYEDAVKEGDVRSTTNSYQTFRQEFKLEQPVAADKVLKSIKDDGTITILIPKKYAAKREGFDLDSKLT